MRDAAFEPLDPGTLRDRELVLVLDRVDRDAPEQGRVPQYSFSMRHADSGEELGSIRLRLTDRWEFTHHNGHVGFTVLAPHRGNRYAARSTRLLLPLAAAHGLDPIWITCNPENLASARSCELAGGEYVDTVEIPEESSMYAEGERLKMRYRLATDVRAAGRRGAADSGCGA